MSHYICLVNWLQAGKQSLFSWWFPVSHAIQYAVLPWQRVSLPSYGLSDQIRSLTCDQRLVKHNRAPRVTANGHKLLDTVVRRDRAHRNWRTLNDVTNGTELPLSLSTHYAPHSLRIKNFRILPHFHFSAKLRYKHSLPSSILVFSFSTLLLLLFFRFPPSLS